MVGRVKDSLEPRLHPGKYFLLKHNDVESKITNLHGNESYDLVRTQQNLMIKDPSKVIRTPTKVDSNRGSVYDSIQSYGNMNLSNSVIANELQTRPKIVRTPSDRKRSSSHLYQDVKPME